MVLPCTSIVFFQEENFRLSNDRGLVHRFLRFRVGEHRAGVVQAVPLVEQQQVVGIVIGMEYLVRFYTPARCISAPESKTTFQAV